MNENRKRISAIRRVVSLLEQSPPRVAEAIEELKNADPSIDEKRIAFELTRAQVRALMERRDLSQDERRSVSEAINALAGVPDRGNGSNKR